MEINMKNIVSLLWEIKEFKIIWAFFLHEGIPIGEEHFCNLLKFLETL